MFNRRERIFSFSVAENESYDGRSADTLAGGWYDLMQSNDCTITKGRKLFCPNRIMN